MAATGSMPCQNRWLGSKLAVIAGPHLAEADQRRRVVDDVARVHLDTRQDAVLGGEAPGPASRGPPRAHCHASVREVVRPRARHPVRSPCSLVIAGATGEGVDDSDTEFRSEAHRRPPRLAGAGDRRVGMQRIALLTESADLQTAALDRTAEVVERAAVVEQCCRAAVGVAGVVAGGDLDGLETEGDGAVEGVLERPVVVHGEEHAELHDGARSSSGRSTAEPAASASSASPQVALEGQPAVEADVMQGTDGVGEIDVTRARLPPGAVAELHMTDEAVRHAHRGPPDDPPRCSCGTCRRRA